MCAFRSEETGCAQSLVALRGCRGVSDETAPRSFHFNQSSERKRKRSQLSSRPSPPLVGAPHCSGKSSRMCRWQSVPPSHSTPYFISLGCERGKEWMRLPTDWKPIATLQPKNDKGARIWGMAMEMEKMEMISEMLKSRIIGLGEHLKSIFQMVLLWQRSSKMIFWKGGRLHTLERCLQMEKRSIDKWQVVTRNSKCQIKSDWPRIKGPRAPIFKSRQIWRTSR